MGKNSLKGSFDPIWISDFLDFKLLRLSKTAFVQRQMYRLFRDLNTNICELSDLKIRHITGWHLLTIKKAREQLIKAQEITPCGYHTFKVKPFKHFEESFAENAKPAQEAHSQKMRNQLHNKYETTFVKNANRFRNKCETLITERSTEIQKEPHPVNNPVENQDNDGSRHCRECGNYELEHLDSKGNKSGYCPTLSIALPPFAICNNCQHFEAKP